MRLASNDHLELLPQTWLLEESDPVSSQQQPLMDDMFNHVAFFTNARIEG